MELHTILVWVVRLMFASLVVSIWGGVKARAVMRGVKQILSQVKVPQEVGKGGKKENGNSEGNN